MCIHRKFGWSVYQTVVSYSIILVDSLIALCKYMCLA